MNEAKRRLHDVNLSHIALSYAPSLSLSACAAFHSLVAVDQSREADLEHGILHR